MNKKGQFTIGMIIGTFVVLLVGLVLISPVSDILSETTNTITGQNHTNITVTHTTGQNTVSTWDVVGQELFTASASVTMYNVTAGEDLLSGAPRNNFTFQEGISSTTGLKTIQLVVNGSNFTANTFQLSYNYGQEGYIDDSGGRAIAPLIAIFMALAIGVIALVPTLRSGVLQMMGK